MSVQTPPTEPTTPADQAGEESRRHRAVLDRAIDFNAELAEMIVETTRAVRKSPDVAPALALSLALKAAPALERLTRAIERSALTCHKLAQPAKPARDSRNSKANSTNTAQAAAAHRLSPHHREIAELTEILDRDVEPPFAYVTDADYNDRKTLSLRLNSLMRRDRLEDLDRAYELTDLPIAEVLKYLCHDLGITWGQADLSPDQRLSPHDIEAVRDPAKHDDGTGLSPESIQAARQRVIESNAKFRKYLPAKKRSEFESKNDTRSIDEIMAYLDAYHANARAEADQRLEAKRLRDAAKPPDPPSG